MGPITYYLFIYLFAHSGFVDHIGKSEVHGSKAPRHMPRFGAEKRPGPTLGF